MESIKVVTLNLWGEQPPVERRLALAVQQLRALDPDVVALQEVRQTPTLVNQAGTLAAALGMVAHFEVATRWGGGDEGLALLSRLPIAEREHRELPHATEAERRIVLAISVETATGPLWLYTTHLNYRMTHGQIREDQLVALEAFVAETPSVLPKIVMGDFNAAPDADEIRWLRGLRSVGGRRVYYQDAFLRMHPHDPGHTWSSRNPYTDRLQWLERDRRIDYVFVTQATKDGSGGVLDCRVALDQPDADGHHPSDHFAVYAEVRI